VFETGVTTVSFEVIDVNENSSTCSFEITVLANAPRAEVGADQAVCDATVATLNGNDPQGFLGTWNLISGTGNIESPNSSSTLVTGLSAGENIFTWSIDPQNGCAIETDTLSVFVEPNAALDAGEDQSIQSGAETSLIPIYAPPDGSFVWSPEDGLSCVFCESPIASPTETTLYFVEYTTPLGCVLTDSVFVRVFTEIPNTITPDNDGTNDVWNIPSISDYPNVQVLIYNRWGNEVFSSTGYNEPWDGTRNGEELPTGSYFYIIDYNQDGKENLSGTVNIIR
jgi:gliding motility-associated-like protein